MEIKTAQDNKSIKFCLIGLNKVRHPLPLTLTKRITTPNTILGRGIPLPGQTEVARHINKITIFTKDSV